MIHIVNKAFPLSAEAEFEDTYGHRVIPRLKLEEANRLTVLDTTESKIKRHGKVKLGFIKCHAS